MRRLSLMFSLVVAASCGGGGDNQACTPGASQACTGAGGCSGSQQCNSEGTGFGTCNCGSAIDGGSVTIDANPLAPDAGPPAPDANISSTLFTPCALTQTDRNRDCGWTGSSTFSCTPSTKFRVACSSLCSLGSCTGDTIMRVCPGTEPCSFATSFASNDSSSCGAGTCAGEDCCSEASNTCPASGMFTIVWGPWSSDQVATCDMVLDPCSTTTGGCP